MLARVPVSQYITDKFWCVGNNCLIVDISLNLVNIYFCSDDYVKIVKYIEEKEKNEKKKEKRV